jgi:hypothetical protein
VIEAIEPEISEPTVVVVPGKADLKAEPEILLPEILLPEVTLPEVVVEPAPSK